MMIVVTYDVDTTTTSGERRLRNVAKECVNYGQRVQNSVFECLIDETHFIILRNKIEKIIDFQLDSVRFYILGRNFEKHIICIGKKTSFDLDSSLII
jgi:CRISPR-associated protein Cas2